MVLESTMIWWVWIMKLCEFKRKYWPFVCVFVHYSCCAIYESAQIEVTHSNKILKEKFEIENIFWFSVFSFDNSDYQRNGDYFPTRLTVQKDGLNLIGMTKLRANPENNVGFLTYARWVYPRASDRLNSEYWLFELNWFWFCICYLPAPWRLWPH